MNLNESYWDDRYKNNNTGWDLGMVSPPLKSYFDQLEDKELRILIPGGGNSYEAEYLFSKGFPNIYVVDLSRTVLERFQERVPVPRIHIGSMRNNSVAHSQGSSIHTNIQKFIRILPCGLRRNEHCH